MDLIFALYSYSIKHNGIAIYGSGIWVQFKYTTNNKIKLIYCRVKGVHSLFLFFKGTFCNVCVVQTNKADEEYNSWANEPKVSEEMMCKPF